MLPIQHQLKLLQQVFFTPSPTFPTAKSFIKSANLPARSPARKHHERTYYAYRVWGKLQQTFSNWRIQKNRYHLVQTGFKGSQPSVHSVTYYRSEVDWWLPHESMYLIHQPVQPPAGIKFRRLLFVWFRFCYGSSQRAITKEPTTRSC